MSRIPWLGRLARKSFDFWLALIYRRAKYYSTPNLKGVPVSEVFRYFFRGIVNGAITTRASAVAFSFFLATVPLLIFIFTLIPYLPLKDFHQQLLELARRIMPTHAYLTVEATLIEVVTTKSSGLLSFGFLAAVIFSHNGVSALIDAFNATYHSIETRSFLEQHLIALLLTFILPLVVVVGIVLLFFGENLLNILGTWGVLQSSTIYVIAMIIKWLLAISVFFFGISLVYYLAPSRKDKFKFFSPGSVLATLLILLTSFAFSYYVNHFGQYNKFYGSLGGLIAFQLWLYFNAFGLILGFDLNASIKKAINEHKARIDIQMD